MDNVESVRGKKASEIKTHEWIPVTTEDGGKTPFELHADRSTGKYELYDKRIDMCFAEVTSMDFRYVAFKDITSETVFYFLPLAERKTAYDSRTPMTDKGVFKAGVVPLTF